MMGISEGKEKMFHLIVNMSGTGSSGNKDRYLFVNIEQGKEKKNDAQGEYGRHQDMECS